MSTYSQIKLVLRTIFNVENGLSEEVSRRLLVRSRDSPAASAAFLAELEAAFADPNLSWKSMLCNDEYEVVDVETEQEAADFARRNLADPFAPKPVERAVAAKSGRSQC